MSSTSIEVRTRAPYRVTVGAGILDDVAASTAEASRRAVLTDRNVESLYVDHVRLGDAPVLAVEPGEGSKSFATLETVLDFLAAADLDRRSTLVALGGGVVGDLGGLAASLYMRGIDVVQCPTTLLAQVDSSVGGKTAVNLTAGKNLAGTFHQPREVFADTETLATLSDEELRSGLGEVVKSALIGDGELFALLEERADDVLARDADVLSEVVVRCVRVKAEVVARDEREGGERKKLNLGHTFAHAIEQVAGYGEVPHGVAVACGLVLALQASERVGSLEEPDLTARAAQLLRRLGMCADLGELRERYGVQLGKAELLAGLRHDKKGAAGVPAFVVPRGVGAIELDRGLEGGLLAELLA